MTLLQAVHAGAIRLSFHHHLRGNARRDAETLLLHTLGIPRTTLLAYPSRILSAGEQAAFEAAITRRYDSEPIQYITGEQEFYGLALKVTPDVLIPRPETELLVEAVLSRLGPDAGRAVGIADVGTGSGAIAIALAVHLPQARVTAVDLSEAALAVARGNAVRHHVADRIQFLRSDLLAGVNPATVFDAVVSNPPYVPESDRAMLHPEVRDHEPALALFAGDSGLAVYRRLIPQAERMLKPGGLLALEIGHGQSDAVASLLEGWSPVKVLLDLQQIPRVVLANRG